METEVLEFDERLLRRERKAEARVAALCLLAFAALSALAGVLQ